VSICFYSTDLALPAYISQDPVIAQADGQYPEWLWMILRSKAWPDNGTGGKAEQVQRWQENRQG
ncbi:hypothetical protein AMATHDRAFT_142022, partial [Amanita thiersii Skay4041]